MINQDDDRLLQAYLDQRLTPGETFQVEQRLCQEPEFADRLIQFASDETVITEWAANLEPSLKETPLQDELPVDVPETVSEEVTVTRGRFFIPSLVVSCLILFMAGLYFWGPQLDDVDSETVVLSTGERIQNHIRQTLAEGSAELHFPTGAKVLISAPAAYEVTGKNSIHLRQGKFIANVPSTGIGFQVDTPHGRVVDLGTLFSVQTADADDTRVQVYRGKVIASVIDGQGIVKTSRQVDENQSAKIDYQKNEIEDTPDSYELSRRYGIKAYSSCVIFQEQMPEALATGKYQVFEHDDLAFVFPERQQVVLPQNVTVEVSPTSAEQQAGKILNYNISIPQQTKVDCFRVYYDPAVSEGQFIPVEGKIVFERPILGVILKKKRLNQTDRFFLPLYGTQREHNIAHQGTEVDRGIFDPKDIYDEISISEDRKTLSFLLLSGERFVDEFRVLVESTETPAQ
ncbi:FecR family protein [Gimesia fumaroli]|uniref:FecR protein n=1 Tax=Gimesia fumaroli TaxID=2527976 RepID=A0A518IEC4_9PLAN|nr:FecR family protein [Gimesia fumaroli]QDV51451.1 FecR protein [Gimesia fumaroli]